MMSQALQRIRILHTKAEPLRYTSNLDMQKIWERTLRRAHLPITYSQGFHPQPRINQACPLPLGITSQVEIVDIWFNADLSPIDVRSQLERVLPPGISLTIVEAIDLSFPTLQSRVSASQYSALLDKAIDLFLLSKKIEVLLAAASIPRQRRGKNYDLRPLLDNLELLPAKKGERPHLQMQLAARSNATGRPDEVLDELGLDSVTACLERTALWVDG
jgi:radical SAM-linked protein